MYVCCVHILTLLAPYCYYWSSPISFTSVYDQCTWSHDPIGYMKTNRTFRHDSYYSLSPWLLHLVIKRHYNRNYHMWRNIDRLNIGKYLHNQTWAVINWQIIKTVILDGREKLCEFGWLWGKEKLWNNNYRTVVITPFPAAHLPVKSFWMEVKLKHSPCWCGIVFLSSLGQFN